MKNDTDNDNIVSEYKEVRTRHGKSRRNEINTASRKIRPEYDASEIPAYLKKDGFQQKYGRINTLGMSDSALNTNLQDGWQPVPIERDIGNNYNTLLNSLTDTRNRAMAERNALSSQYIVKEDLILLEISDKQYEEIEKRRHKDLMTKLASNEAYKYFDASLQDKIDDLQRQNKVITMERLLSLD